MLACACFATHAPFAPALPADRDGVHFADGVERWDPLHDRPHWPGYPVYIWAGRVAALGTGDSFEALRLLSVAATSAMVFPIAALAGAIARRSAVGVAAASVWVAIPASWLDGTEMFSDPLGLLLASVAYAVRARPVLAGVLAGLAVGARPDMVTLGAPLVLLGPRAVGAAALTCAGWFGWMLLATSPSAWVDAAVTMLDGHFGAWGGSATTDAAVWERPVRWLHALSRYELGTWWPGLGSDRWPATLVLLPALALGLVRGPLRPILWALGPYVAFQLVIHPVEVARYGLPLAAVAVLLVANGLPHRHLASSAGLVVAALLAVSLPLAVQHAVSVPLGIQEVRALANTSADPILVRVRASPFRARFAPELDEVVLGPDTTIERLGATRVLVATRDTLLAAGVPPTGWSPLPPVRTDPEVHSRGPWVTHLYIRRPDPIRSAPALVPCPPEIPCPSTSGPSSRWSPSRDAATPPSPSPAPSPSPPP